MWTTKGNPLDVGRRTPRNLGLRGPTLPEWFPKSRTEIEPGVSVGTVD